VFVLPSGSGRWLRTGEHIVRGVICRSDLCWRRTSLAPKLKLGAGFQEPSPSLSSGGVLWGPMGSLFLVGGGSPQGSRPQGTDTPPRDRESGHLSLAALSAPRCEVTQQWDTALDFFVEMQDRGTAGEMWMGLSWTAPLEGYYQRLSAGTSGMFDGASCILQSSCRYYAKEGCLLIG